MNPFSTSSDEDIIGHVDKRSENRTKNKQDPTTPQKAPKLKFTTGDNKGKSQGEPSISNVQETKESKVQDENLNDEHLDLEPIDVDQLEDGEEDNEEHADEYDEEGLPQSSKNY